MFRRRDHRNPIIHPNHTLGCGFYSIFLESIKEGHTKSKGEAHFRASNAMYYDNILERLIDTKQIELRSQRFFNHLKYCLRAYVFRGYRPRRRAALPPSHT